MPSISLPPLPRDLSEQTSTLPRLRKGISRLRRRSQKRMLLLRQPSLERSRSPAPQDLLSLSRGGRRPSRSRSSHGWRTIWKILGTGLSRSSGEFCRATCLVFFARASFPSSSPSDFPSSISFFSSQVQNRHRLLHLLRSRHGKFARRVSKPDLPASVFLNPLAPSKVEGKLTSFLVHRHFLCSLLAAWTWRMCEFSLPLSSSAIQFIALPPSTSPSSSFPSFRLPICLLTIPVS